MAKNIIPMNWNNNNNININNLNINALFRNENNNNKTIRATPLYPTLYSVVIASGEELNLAKLFRSPKMQKMLVVDLGLKFSRRLEELDAFRRLESLQRNTGKWVVLKTLN